MLKKSFIKSLITLLIFIALPHSAIATAERIDFTLLDGNGNPITTAQDIRISLWATYDVRSGEIDGNGDIDTNTTHYGGYQTTFTITPDGDNAFIARHQTGFYKLYIKDLVSFPDPLGSNNVFLQLEYKNQGAANTNYQVYDFVDDPPWQNVSRYLLVSNVSYYTYDAGPQTYNNTFTLDGNNNAATEITLQFGETLAESLKWSKVNVRFELSDNLYIDGTLTLNGNLDFAAFELINARVENLSVAPTCDATAKGRLYYNTGDNLIYFCNGTGWNQL